MEERGHLEQRGSKGRKVSKQQRRSFDAKFKLMAIKAAEATNNCQAAKKYGVTEGHVRKWRVQKERLKNANTMRKAFRGPKSGRFREIERRVREYVIEKRKEGMPISRAMIQLKARELADEFKIPPTEFKASLGWCKRMIRRSGLVLRHRPRRTSRTSRTSLVQCLPSDFKEKLLSCQRYVHELRKKHHYPLDQMGYAGQTPVYFDMPSPVTVEKKGKVPVKSTDNEKNRITVMLACLADGTKLPPYVVLQGKTIPEEPTPPGIIVRAQEMGWIGTELMVDWLKAVWGRRRGWLRKTRNMLMLDAFRGPLTEPVEKQLRSMNGDLVIIPGGMTNQLEVLDVVVNKPFKDTLLKKYTEWLPSADQAPTPTGGIQQPAVPLLCEWVLQAWDAVSSESIINGFKKFCASNAMDGSEDDVLWEEAGPAEQPEDDWSDGSQDDAGPAEQPEDDWSVGSQDDVLLEEAGPAEQPEDDWSDGSQDDVLLEEAGPAEQPEDDWSDESDSEPSEAEDPSKFNRGVPADMKKQTWAEITARVNEIGECQREVMEVIKKWSDLKCDTKRKVAAMQAGTVPNRGLNSRLSRDLNPTEKIVLQILEMGAEDQSSDDFGPLGDDDDVPEEEEEMEDEDMMKMQSSPSNSGLETESMPLPSSSHMSGNTQTGDTPQPSSDGQEEAVPSEEMEPVFPDSDSDGRDDDLPSTQTTKPAEDHQANNGVQKEAPPPPPPAALPPALPEALPAAAPPPQSSRDSMLQNASLSLQEQHATNLLLETVSRSLELLSESVQQLAETQQEFVRESLQLQRETVQVLRDFTGGAIALMHDKLNGRPAL